MKWNISSMIPLICISTFVLILSLLRIKILYLSVICFIIIKKSVAECSPPPLLMEYTALQSVLNLRIKGEKYSPCTEQLFSCSFSTYQKTFILLFWAWSYNFYEIVGIVSKSGQSYPKVCVRRHFLLKMIFSFYVNHMREGCLRPRSQVEEGSWVGNREGRWLLSTRMSGLYVWV